TQLGGPLGPPPRLRRAVRARARHHPVPADRLHGRLQDLGALLGGEGLVLAERAVGDDAVAAVLHEPAAVPGVRVVVDGQVVAERECGGDHDAVPGVGPFGHYGTIFLAGTATVLGEGTRREPG